MVSNASLWHIQNPHFVHSVMDRVPAICNVAPALRAVVGDEEELISIKEYLDRRICSYSHMDLSVQCGLAYRLFPLHSDRSMGHIERERVF